MLKTLAPGGRSKVTLYFVLPLACVAAFILLCLFILTTVLLVSGLGVLFNAPSSGALHHAALGILIGSIALAISGVLGAALVGLSRALFLSVDRMIHLRG